MLKRDMTNSSPRALSPRAGVGVPYTALGDFGCVRDHNRDERRGLALAGFIPDMVSALIYAGLIIGMAKSGPALGPK